jgi:tryptophanyl-tRNA synthetase
VGNKPGVSNLMTIYGLIKEMSMEEVEKEFNGIGYGDFKIAVAEVVIEKLKPVQNKYNELMGNPELLKKIYEDGAKKAIEKTGKLIKEVYEKIGLVW